MNKTKHEKQIKVAEILYENGMELPLIEKITGVASLELLAKQIRLEESNSKIERKKGGISSHRGTYETKNIIYFRSGVRGTSG